MFDIGWSEMLVVGAVALVVIGPKDLPGALRQAGRWMGSVRRVASDFQGQVNQAMREAELDEFQREVRGIKSDIDGLGAPVVSKPPEMTPLPKPKPAAKTKAKIEAKPKPKRAAKKNPKAKT